MIEYVHPISCVWCVCWNFNKEYEDSQITTYSTRRKAKNLYDKLKQKLPHYIEVGQQNRGHIIAYHFNDKDVCMYVKVVRCKLGTNEPNVLINKDACDFILK